jgi:hypothetical protein
VKLHLSLPCALLTLALGFSAAPMQAQFIVHDPINDIQLIYQNGTLLQQVQETVTLFNLAYQETNALRHKNLMLAASYLSNFGSYGIPGHSNWTIGLSTAGGMIPATLIWREMATSLTPGMTIQNRVQLADAMGPSMIESLGGCNASLLQSDGAIGALEQVALSTSLLDNTNDALGGAASVGTVQQLRIQECQHNLQQQQAQLQLLQLMRQRDYDNAQYNTYQNIDVIAASNPRGIINISSLNLADF